ncbi:hypothetical protein [Marinomonas sp.]
MSTMLHLSLISVHNSPRLEKIVAAQAINSGGHESIGGNEGHSHHHSHF